MVNRPRQRRSGLSNLGQDFVLDGDMEMQELDDEDPSSPLREPSRSSKPPASSDDESSYCDSDGEEEVREEEGKEGEEGEGGGKQPRKSPMDYDTVGDETKFEHYVLMRTRE